MPGLSAWKTTKNNHKTAKHQEKWPKQCGENIRPHASMPENPLIKLPINHE
jgi:hypothetical protein